MNNNLLIPTKYKVIGWIVLLIFVPLGLSTMIWEFSIPGFNLPHTGTDLLNGYNLTNELALAGIIVGLLMVAFAKEPNEDEYISFIRLKAWQWSVLFSYLLLFVINWAAYNLYFFYAMVFNMFTVLIIFIGKFYFSIYKLNREKSSEE